jgi:hypothetical protein
MVGLRMTYEEEVERIEKGLIGMGTNIETGLKVIGFDDVEENGEIKMVIKVRTSEGEGVNAYVTKKEGDKIYFTNHYDYFYNKDNKKVYMVNS